MFDEIVSVVRVSSGNGFRFLGKGVYRSLITRNLLGGQLWSLESWTGSSDVIFNSMKSEIQFQNILHRKDGNNERHNIFSSLYADLRAYVRVIFYRNQQA